jgi:hypothetical protein
MHTHLLRKFEYFSTMLDDRGKVAENQSILRLPDFNADAFDQVLHYILQGEFSFRLLDGVDRTAKHTPPDKFTHRFRTMLKTHLLARRLGAERLQNLTINIIRWALQKVNIGAQDLIFILENCESADDPLRRLATVSLQISARESGAWPDFIQTNVFKEFANLSKEYMSTLASALFGEAADNDLHEWKGPCSFHVHEKNSTCEELEGSIVDSQGWHYDRYT